MKKVLIATEKPFAKAAVESITKIVTESGFESLLFEKYTQQEELINAVKAANALIIRSDVIDKAVIDAAPNLEIVVRAGAGYDNIDLAACSARGIVAMNTPGQNANAVAELVFGMVIHLIRHQFDGSTGTELRNKKLGIHGYGYIGKIVALIAKGFGMKVHAYDPFIDHVIIENDGVVCEAKLDDLYSKCQYITLHVPANEKTKKSINFDLLSKMPDGACLINTARKEIIDETGLLKMFETRKDFLYTSDISPDNAAEISEKFKGRYYFTPKKTGAQTHEANNNAGLAAANQIVNFFLKGDKTYQVNK
jgi:D-3-phosphoglycerate dehydrogenase / 2-oxoglutarate reductase